MEEIIQLKELLFAAPISWYCDILETTEIQLNSGAKFPKHAARNRFDYVTIQGARSITIPLVSQSRKGTYRDVEISYHENWHKQMINALKTSYGKSPFYEYYGYRFEKIINAKHNFLWDLNIQVLEETISCLKLDIKLSEVQADALHEQETPKNMMPYYQVYADTLGFIKDMSILDLIFNMGMDTYEYLIKNNAYAPGKLIL